MANILFICGHDPDAERKVDLHFFAQHLVEEKHQVSFIIIGSSLAGYLSGRSTAPVLPNQWSKPGRYARFFWYPLFHPMRITNLFLLPISRFLYKFYSDLMPVSSLKEHGPYDVILVESGAGLALIPTLKKIYPDSKFIYSVSDRLARLNVPESVYNYELKPLIALT